MRIQSLNIQNLRNLREIQLIPNEKYTLFTGENGSGKTSLLEAIYLLGLGRSFRTMHNKRLIKDNSEKLIVSARLKQSQDHTINIGIEKHINGLNKIRIAGEEENIASLAALLPIKLLNNDSFFFLTHGPKYRRQFLDWGVFHVKHQFLSLWREYQQCLKQRNLALKRLLPTEQIIVWDKLLIKTAMTINALRKEYISELLLVFKGLFKKFLDIQGLVINFYQGWPKESEFAAILEDNLKKDRDLGYTYYGLHRADLKITINNKPAQDVLSRGQQKVFIWTLNLAQTLLLKRQTQKSSVILMDDLPSELDANKRQAIFDILDDVNAQVFITAIDKNIVESIINNMDDSNYTMFHVKHGEISYSRDRLDGI